MLHIRIQQGFTFLLQTSPKQTICILQSHINRKDLSVKLILTIELKEKEYQQAILDNTNKLKQEFNQNLTQKQSELKEALSKLDQINKFKLEQEQQNKMELEKIQQYNKSLQFSNTYKHNSCQVSEGGKLVADVNNGSCSCYCLCEQAIPKTGKIQFAFQILSGSYFYVGIGFRDIMQKYNYQSCYQTGTYLIKQNGNTYSHHNKDLQSKQLSFVFTNNDIIIIEVCIENKYIKWSKQNNPLLAYVVQLDIDTSQELYPCVGVNNSKIKLLDNISV
ncbi:unnamed protein product [Paramecium pentaurelia]|uniref:Uncharacterized protein n=1 Tax=Paramecium pentaurelia TaxID=43138 RepID=A0A8S1YF26_9CILI|nr:unnamed protein product [Paramecium pentaurelia]